MSSRGRLAISLFGNPRFSNTRRLVAFLHGKTIVFPNPFQVRFLSAKKTEQILFLMCHRQESNLYQLVRSEPFYPLNYDDKIALYKTKTKSTLYSAFCSLYYFNYAAIPKSSTIFGLLKPTIN